MSALPEAAVPGGRAAPSIVTTGGLR